MLVIALEADRRYILMIFPGKTVLLNPVQELIELEAWLLLTYVYTAN